MQKSWFGLLFAAAISQSIFVAPTLADPVFVSRTGADANGCSATSPCATIQHALSVSPAAGEVIVVDSGAYGPFTIGKSVTIRAMGAVASIYGQVVINAGTSDRVVLDGLDLNGSADSNGGRYEFGVLIQRAGDVFIRNCRIQGYGTGDDAAIYAVNTSHLRLTVEGSTLTGNDRGIYIASTPNMGALKVFNSTLLSNTLSGIRIVGSGNEALISNSQILGSTKALDLVSGGKAISYGNNVITSGDAPTRTSLN